jgi:ATP-dependent Lhr-like helicase
MAACEAVEEGQRDGESFRPGGLDVLAQHVMARACAGPFEGDLLRPRCVSACLCLGRSGGWARVLDFVATGGYACAPMTGSADRAGRAGCGG